MYFFLKIYVHESSRNCIATGRGVTWFKRKVPNAGVLRYWTLVFLYARTWNFPNLFDQICSELDITTPTNIYFESIDEVQTVDEGKSFKLALRLDGEIINFDVIYDINANELYSVVFSED